MAEFKIDENKLLDIIDMSIMVWVNVLENEVKKAVPRDKKRLPKPIILKTKAKPERNIRAWNKHFYRLPVNIAWNWYAWVTGNLARSINTQKVSFWQYQVWVMAWIVEDYAFTQEFWDQSRNIEKRSFLLEPLEKNKDKIMEQIQKTMIELLNKI